jgi:hypothetical protein
VHDDDGPDFGRGGREVGKIGPPVELGVQVVWDGFDALHPGQVLEERVRG